MSSSMSGRADVTAVTITSARRTSDSRSRRSAGCAPPSSSSQTASARARVLLATTSSPGRSAWKCWVASRPNSPAPTTSTCLSERSLKIFFVSVTAADVNETAPAPISVSERARLPVRRAVSRRRLRKTPADPPWQARLYASFTWPRICTSPSTTESRRDAQEMARRLAVAVCVGVRSGSQEVAPLQARDHLPHVGLRAGDVRGQGVELGAVARREDHRLGQNVLAARELESLEHLFGGEGKALPQLQRSRPVAAPDDEELGADANPWKEGSQNLAAITDRTMSAKPTRESQIVRRPVQPNP